MQANLNKDHFIKKNELKAYKNDCIRETWKNVEPEKKEKK